MRSALKFGLRHRWWWLASIALLTGLALWAAAELDFDDGMQSTFTGGHPAVARLDAYQERFGSSQDDIVILIEGASFEDPEALVALRDFVTELQLAPDFVGITSIFSLPAPPDGSGELKALLPGALPPAEALPAMLDEVRAHPIMGRALLSEDGELTAVIAALAGTQEHLVAVQSAIEEIDRAADLVLPVGMTHRVTGLGPIRLETLNTIVSDTMLLLGVGAVLATFANWLFLRRLRLVFIAGMTSGAALLWTFGAQSALGLPITTLSTVLPAIVVVLALSDGLHLMGEAGRLIRAGEDVEEAICDAWHRVGPACVMTSLTTAVAFGLLATSDSNLVSKLGISGVLGTSCAFGSVMFVLPLLSALVGRGGWERGPKEGLMDAGLPERLAHIALARPWVTFILAACGFVVLVSLASNVRPTFHFWEYVSPTSESRGALILAEERLAPPMTIDLPLTLAEGADAQAVLSTLEARIEALEGVEIAFSPGKLTPWVEEAGGLEALLTSTDGGRKSTLLAEDGTYLLRAHTAVAQAADLRALAARIEAEARATAGVVGEPRVTGILALSSEVSREMIRSMINSLLQAVALSVIVIALWLRSPWLGLVAFVPNVLPMVAFAAFAATTGLGLNFTGAVVATIAYGIAVDDTIHVLNHWRLGRAGTETDAARRAAAAAHDAGPAILATTVVLSAGLVGALFADGPMTIYFGAVAIAIFIIALLADLVILPALLALGGPVWLRRRGIFPGDSEV